MIKKIFLSLLITLLLSFSGVFADEESGLDATAGEKDEACMTSDCLSSPNFIINVEDIAPGGESLVKGSAEETAKATLQTIITKLILAFGVLALFIMTIGGGYMIIYHGQDELLSKGKSIFMSGLISLVIALGAGLLVELVAYLLYTGN